MPPLHRHQLAHLSAAGWRDILGRNGDDELRACLQLWADGNLPLVVTRQPRPARDGEPLPVALGLSAPALFNGRRVALQVPPAQIAWFGEFPLLAETAQLLPRAARPRLDAMGRALATLGVKARVYGSVGWQQMTGLKYMHEQSDLDLWLAVGSANEADAAAQVLLRHAPARPRLDGELLFVDGSAVAWREWLAWRTGACRSLMVKRLHDASIERDAERFTGAAGWACAA